MGRPLPLIAFLAISAVIGNAKAAAIVLTQPLFVSSISDAGVSFSYTGTLATSDTISFTATMQPCLQSPSVYCTNAAGVVVVAGSSPVGGSSQNPDNSKTFGALLLTISGQTEQIFLPTAANGAGSASPPTSLTLATTTLSALSFSFASLSNPTVQFTVSDQSIYRGDNIGGFQLTQNGTTPVATPEPISAGLLTIGLIGLAISRRRQGQANLNSVLQIQSGRGV